MSDGDALDARGIANLWVVVFGEPPVVIDDPALMLNLIEEHLERRRGAGHGGEGDKVRTPVAMSASHPLATIGSDPRRTLVWENVSYRR